MSAGPYRDGKGRGDSQAADDQGIVGELIAQFADPLAFYRELVQNAIDAGTESVHVSLMWEPEVAGSAEGGVVHVSVRDTGEGMDREVLEEQLLVLFRSGKEGQEGKIGKFGVGFVSVLALAPRLVVVSTSRGDGRAWAMHLHPDQTYDLFQLTGGSSSGTTVTLRVPMHREALAEFIDNSRAALVRWCRHASVPIHLAAQVSGESEILAEARLDRPLDLDALVSVRSDLDGVGQLIVGIGRGNLFYAGFFNQGLMLWETNDSPLHPLSFKVLDPRLEHTLSRDDVRRDAAFDRVLSAVRKVARDQLSKTAVASLAEAAQAPLERGYGRLVTALHQTSGALHRMRWTLPLLDVAGNRQTITSRDLPTEPLYGRSQTELTAALARRGTPVIDAREGAMPVELLGALSRGRPGDVHGLLTLVVPEEHTPVDLALLERVVWLLGKVARRPRAPLFARLVGAGLAAPVLAGDEVGDPWILTPAQSAVDPLRFLARPRLVINRDHELVAAVRGRAALDLDLAATMLARAVLIWTDRLDEASDFELGSVAIELLVGGVS